MGKLKKVILIGGLAAATYAATFGGLFTYDKAKEQTYNEYIEDSISTEEQIKILLGATNADSGFLNKFTNRLLNNGDDPVYVSFDDNFYKEENKILLDISTDVLDTFFGIVYDINDKYTYEIIPQTEALKKGDKTATINFYFDKLNSSWAQVAHYKNKAHIDLTINSKAFDTNNIYPSNYTMTDEYRAKRLKLFKNKLKTTLVHECDHIFGIDDIYNINYAHADTAVDVKYRDGSSNSIMPTPNDYACMLSMYTPNLSTLELADFIEDIPNKLTNYKQNYYDTMSLVLQDRTEDDCLYPKNFTSSTFNIDWNSVHDNMFVEINDDKYKMCLYDDDKNIVSSYEGDVYKTKYHIFLDNIYFPNGLYNGKANSTYYNNAHYQSIGLTLYEKKGVDIKKKNGTIYDVKYYKDETYYLVDTAGLYKCGSQDTQRYIISREEYLENEEEYLENEKEN